MMRHIRYKVTTSMFVALLAACLVATPVYANGQQVAYLSKITRGTNVTCAKGSKKVFTVMVSVQQSQRIVSHGPFTLQLQSGKQIFSDGKKVNNRLVKYRYAQASRTAKVSRTLDASNAFIETSDGAQLKATVSAMCKPSV